MTLLEKGPQQRGPWIFFLGVGLFEILFSQRVAYNKFFPPKKGSGIFFSRFPPAPPPQFVNGRPLKSDNSFWAHLWKLGSHASLTICCQSSWSQHWAPFRWWLITYLTNCHVHHLISMHHQSVYRYRTKMSTSICMYFVNHLNTTHMHCAWALVHHLSVFAVSPPGKCTLGIYLYCQKFGQQWSVSTARPPGVKTIYHPIFSYHLLALQTLLQKANTLAVEKTVRIEWCTGSWSNRLKLISSQVQSKKDSSIQWWTKRDTLYIYILSYCMKSYI